MTSAQSRAARALLAITQTELAQMANLGLSTVVDFERKRREVSDDAIEAMRRAFEARGIQFLDENEAGEGVRFRHPRRRMKKKHFTER